ncbi:MAG: mechanosensitive ion channel domain-containing protein [Aurantibacter sp.]
MEEFFELNKSELFWTGITLVALLLLKFIGNKTVRRIGKISNIVEARTRLIIKYISLSITFLGIGALTFIWGVNFKDVGLLFSSVFAVIGVALFAQWSILSNVTSGVILFFSFPYKIGDHIKIMDKEITEGDEGGHDIYVIEDIKAFHLHLRSNRGELMTYPNNLMLQKAIALVNTYDRSAGDKGES